MLKPTKERPIDPNVRSLTKSVRFSPEELRVTMTLAHQTTGGNLGELIRYALEQFRLAYEPAWEGRTKLARAKAIAAQRKKNR